MIHLALLLISAEATQIQVIGAGTNSCGSFVATKDQPMSRGVYMQWLNGFLTEFNISNREGILDVSEYTDRAGMETWLDGYCTNHPLLPLSTASEALLMEMSAQKRRIRNSK